MTRLSDETREQVAIAAARASRHYKGPPHTLDRWLGVVDAVIAALNEEPSVLTFLEEQWDEGCHSYLDQMERLLGRLKEEKARCKALRDRVAELEKELRTESALLDGTVARRIIGDQMCNQARAFINKHAKFLIDHDRCTGTEVSNAMSGHQAPEPEGT